MERYGLVHLRRVPIARLCLRSIIPAWSWSCHLKDENMTLLSSPPRERTAYVLPRTKSVKSGKTIWGISDSSECS